VADEIKICHSLRRKKMNKFNLRKDVILTNLYGMNYLIDTESGWFFSVDKEFLNILIDQEYQENEKTQKFLEELENNGLTEGSEEKQKPKWINFSVTDSTPFSLCWEITENCNLRCQHCYIEEKNKKIEPLESLIKDFFEITKISTSLGKQLSIGICGGEPLMYPYLEELLVFLQSCQDKVKKIRLLTNGTLLTSEKAKKLKKLGICNIQVSLDGDKAGHEAIRGRGTFTSTLQGISAAIQAGFKTTVQMVLNTINYRSIDSVVSILSELGVRKLNCALMIPTGEGANLKNQTLTKPQIEETFKHINELSHKSKKLKIQSRRPIWCLVNESRAVACIPGLERLTLKSDGTILACSELPVAIGNIREGSIIKIWAANALLTSIRNRNFGGKCKDCNKLNTCGGCRAMAYAMTGDPLAEDPTCWA
jgi:radical SAM protein with 4Fe4S-binding SPASM domain